MPDVIKELLKNFGSTSGRPHAVAAVCPYPPHRDRSNLRSLQKKITNPLKQTNLCLTDDLADITHATILGRMNSKCGGKICPFFLLYPFGIDREYRKMTFHPERERPKCTIEFRLI